MSVLFDCGGGGGGQNMLLPRQLMAGHLAMLRSTAYSPQHPTKIFIHGFGQSAVSDFIAQAREGRHPVTSFYETSLTLGIASPPDDESRHKIGLL